MAKYVAKSEHGELTLTGSDRFSVPGIMFTIDKLPVVAGSNYKLVQVSVGNTASAESAQDIKSLAGGTRIRVYGNQLGDVYYVSGLQDTDTYKVAW